MEVLQILSVLRHNKVGAILIAAQIAITLAILCNALSVVRDAYVRSERPTGTDEANILVIGTRWLEEKGLSARVQTDLAALRALPGVVDACVSSTFPLSNAGWSEAVKLAPSAQSPAIGTALYFVDEHAIRAMGLKLVAGRNFSADQVAEYLWRGSPLFPSAVSGAIVNRAVAQSLFPKGNVLGQTIYIQGQADMPAQIIGIIDKLQGPWTTERPPAPADHAILLPLRWVSQSSTYIVRAQPGQLAAVQRSVKKALIAVDRTRLIDEPLPMSVVRLNTYRGDRGFAVILGTVSLVALVVTTFAIVGLTSYWVAQRQRQIGIRRAVGATRLAIVRYFQTENLLIAGVGAIVGVALTVALNIWMISTFEMLRLETAYVITGALIVIVLGQLAALWPALRASSIPPAIAARSV